jgi:hypothetical protein
MVYNIIIVGKLAHLHVCGYVHVHVHVAVLVILYHTYTSCLNSCDISSREYSSD